MRLCLFIFVCVGDHHISTNLQQSWVLVRSFSFFEAIEFHIVTCFICGVQVTSCDWLTQGQISHGRATALLPSVSCHITWWVRIHCPYYFVVESIEWHFFDHSIFFFFFNLIIKCNKQSVQCSNSVSLCDKDVFFSHPVWCSYVITLHLASECVIPSRCWEYSFALHSSFKMFMLHSYFSSRAAEAASKSCLRFCAVCASFMPSVCWDWPHSSWMTLLPKVGILPGRSNTAQLFNNLNTAGLGTALYQIVTVHCEWIKIISLPGPSNA